MAARRSRGGRSGKLALKIGLVTGLAGFCGCALVVAMIVSKLQAHLAGEDIEKLVKQTYMIGIALGGIAGLCAGGVAFAIAAGAASRLTDLGLAVSKMGRGTKTSVRVSGNDEVSVLARAVSSLASELAGQAAGEEGAGPTVNFDPQLRELRDKALHEGAFTAPPGFEVDAALSAGSSCGSDYFAVHAKDGVTVLHLVSAAGQSAAAVLAARLAHDEIARALAAGANARKALAHTNRVLNKSLPRGVCATATMVEVQDKEVKVYQAGSRVPVVLCTAGELEDLTAEGLALGLDSGPVFEKGLRSATLAMASGMRLVVLNDAGNRNEELVESIRAHSPKHTAPFMSMVLGELEAGAGAGGLREDVVLMTLKRS